MINAFELIKEKLEESQFDAEIEEPILAETNVRELFETQVVTLVDAISIVDEVEQEYDNGWIACSEDLPPQPKENVLLDNKPLELYLVTELGVYYPFRAFWNGKTFTDGIREVKVTAWQPLPAPYKEGDTE